MYKNVIGQYKSHILISKKYQLFVYQKLIKRFVGWILMGIKNISQKMTNQIYYYTHLMSWRGISSSGLDVLSEYGYLISSRTYFNHNKKRIIDHNIKVNKMLTDNRPKVFWIDNFNKVQKHSTNGL